MNNLEDNPVKSQNLRLFVFVMMVLVVGFGTLVFLLGNIPDLFFDVRFLYFVLFLSSVIIIATQVKQWRLIGLISPISATLFGFIWFLFLSPIIVPQKLSFLYNDVGNILNLVFFIALGMFAFVVGYYSVKSSRFHYLDNWLSKPISVNVVSNAVLFVLLIYIFVILMITNLSNISLYQFITLSNYSLVTSSPGASLAKEYFGRSAYLLWRSIRYLPFAIAPLAIFCFTQRKTSSLKKVLIFLGMMIMVFRIFGSNARGDLAIVLGSMGVYLMISGGLNKSIKKIHIPVIMIFFSVIILAFLQIRTRRLGGIQTLLDGSTNPKTIINSLEFLDFTYDENYNLYGSLRADQQGRIKYLYGESYVMPFVLFVPRNMWPNKPGGTDMYEKLRTVNQKGYWGTTYSALGELIVNFSRFAIVPGMFIWGILLGWWRWLFIRNLYAEKMKILYSMTVIPLLFLVRGPFHTFVSSILYSMVLTLAILHISSYSYTIGRTS